MKKGLNLKLSGLAILSTVLFAGCAAMKSTDTPTRLYVFDCGEIETRDVSMFSPGVDKGQTKQLTNSCYLIQHAEGTLFWDTGLSDSIPAEGVEFWNGAFKLAVKSPLKSQLEAIGVDPATIDYVGISHFHSDHTGNANYFANSKLVIQQEEFEAGFGNEAEKFGFMPESYDQIKRENIVAVKGDYDVFGDGSVVIKRAVGHTPGHQVLFVDLKDTGPLLLSGDLYHFTKNRTFKRVPSFNFDKDQTLHAMDTIEAFIKKENATLWIQHDKEQNEGIKRSPAYYQ